MDAPRSQLEQATQRSWGWDSSHSQQELVGALLPSAVPPAPHHCSAFPAGLVCPGCVRAVSGSVCNQPWSRERPGPAPAQPGTGGAGAAGARAGEHSPESGSGSRSRAGAGGWHVPSSALGDTTALGTPLGTPWGYSPAMTRLLLPLLLLTALGSTAKLKRRPAAWDDGGEAQRPLTRGCANLTLVLDNWKFAITSQLRNLLLADHQTVLPDYGRIPALSGALDELYRDFRALKEQLGGLSERFAHLEASVEQLSRARGAAAALPRRGGVPLSPRRAPGTPQ
ncbi:uncharacterized protein LOC135424694 [Pseudopipra pipra]|uniref:uncharacterized protein LOC135424694 n=1 Tax=Pseudopipra pipra TaxID=415032 RepID=UPI00313A134B